MGVRLIVTTSADNVIPLRANELSGTCPSHEDSLLPEPTMLYGLTVLAFIVHTPHPVFGGCVGCGGPWPCAHLRLAYRLREGF